MPGTILVPLLQGLASEGALETAFPLARRMNAQLRAMYIRPQPAAVLPYLPLQLGGAPLLCDEIEREGREAAGLERARFEGLMIRHELPAADTAPHDHACADWSERIGEIEPLVTQTARVSDLVVMTRFSDGDTAAERCFDAAVFGSGRPTLLVPKAPMHTDLLQHVLIAWNGSLQASRAVFGAMPLLHFARRVSVFTQPEGEDGADGYAMLAEALASHGITAPQAARSAVPCAVGTALLAVAEISEASLIVMGAYTHSRLRQDLLGGATREVLAEAKIPVLMCH